MESNYRLLHKSNNTHLQTSLPVYFFGLPDNSIYLIYARIYEVNFNKSGLEFVFALLEEYNYDFDNNQIITGEYDKIDLTRFRKSVESREPQIKIIKSYRNIRSFVDAQKFLGRKYRKMTKNCA